MRSETFGRLLKGAISSIAHYEGKTAPVIEEELGGKTLTSAASIQRYKAGHIPPDPNSIEILAEAAVKRGYLNRDWLQSFLHAARYPAPEKLLDKLCPVGPARQRPPRTYENLPAPTYSQFVMREQAFAEVVDGLQQRSAVVLIASLGGMGKTSLAREVASRCLKGEDGAPQFDAVVWVSDKDRPCTTTLSIVLDEIARTLDYPGFTQFEHEEKRREVEQLLRRQKVLLVVDNFETINDGALLSWLLRLPEPSKAIVTSREKQRLFWSSWLVNLRGMSETEARTLIEQRLRALQLAKIASDPAQFEPLITVTGGNPKAIEITLGLIKHERRPLQQIVDDLYAARGEIFTDLFARAWALLDEAARRVLLVASFFPASASAEALSATADVQGFAFDRAVERLADLALLDVQQADLSSAPRYALHPLVRVFAGAKLKDESGFEEGARERWVRWYVQLASTVGYCWNNLRRLTCLDLEQDTVLIVIHWAMDHQRYGDVTALVYGVRYYYQVRHGWIRRLEIERMHVEAAQRNQDRRDVFRAVRNMVEGLSRVGNIEEAEQLVQRLHQLAQDLDLSGEERGKQETALGIYFLARQAYSEARQLFLQSLAHESDLPTPTQMLNRRWLATCLYAQGKVDAARDQFVHLVHWAEELGYTRAIIYTRIKLATIDLDQANFSAAQSALLTARALAEQYQDRERLAMIHRLYARLHTLRGDLPAARASLAEAIDLFERLGMRRELTEARDELARLEALPDAA